jgi:hypothetical protein
MAPYLGLTMETSTIVIGTALVAIALGALYGGRARRRGAPVLTDDYAPVDQLLTPHPSS